MQREEGDVLSCRRCGTEMESSDAFCYGCGTAVMAASITGEPELRDPPGGLSEAEGSDPGLLSSADGEPPLPGAALPGLPPREATVVAHRLPTRQAEDDQVFEHARPVGPAQAAQRSRMGMLTRLWHGGPGGRALLLGVPVVLAALMATGLVIVLGADSAGRHAQHAAPPIPSSAGPQAAPTAAPTGSNSVAPPAVADLASQAAVTAPATAPDGQDAAGTPTSYAPQNMLDKDPLTCWRMKGSGVGGNLTFTFPRAVTVSSVGLINGYAKTDPASGADRYAQERRITEVTWTFADGTSLAQSLSPTTRTLQTINLPATATTGTVALHINSVTEPQTGFDYTAISDVEINGQ